MKNDIDLKLVQDLTNQTFQDEDNLFKAKALAEIYKPSARQTQDGEFVGLTGDKKAECGPYFRGAKLSYSKPIQRNEKVGNP